MKVEKMNVTIDLVTDAGLHIHAKVATDIAHPVEADTAVEIATAAARLVLSQVVERVAREQAGAADIPMAEPVLPTDLTRLVRESIVRNLRNQ